MMPPETPSVFRHPAFYVELDSSAWPAAAPLELPSRGPLLMAAARAVAARRVLGAGGLARRLKISRPLAAELLESLEVVGLVFDCYRRCLYRPGPSACALLRGVYERP